MTKKNTKVINSKSYFSCRITFVSILKIRAKVKDD